MASSGCATHTARVTVSSSTHTRAARARREIPCGVTCHTSAALQTEAAQDPTDSLPGRPQLDMYDDQARAAKTTTMPSPRTTFHYDCCFLNAAGSFAHTHSRTLWLWSITGVMPQKFVSSPHTKHKHKTQPQASSSRAMDICCSNLVQIISTQVLATLLFESSSTRTTTHTHT